MKTPSSLDHYEIKQIVSSTLHHPATKSFAHQKSKDKRDVTPMSNRASRHADHVMHFWSRALRTGSRLGQADCHRHDRAKNHRQALFCVHTVFCCCFFLVMMAAHRLPSPILILLLSI